MMMPSFGLTVLSDKRAMSGISVGAGGVVDAVSVRLLNGESNRFESRRSSEASKPVRMMDFQNPIHLRGA